MSLPKLPFPLECGTRQPPLLHVFLLLCESCGTSSQDAKDKAASTGLRIFLAVNPALCSCSASDISSCPIWLSVP